MISDRFSYRYRIIAFYGALNCLDYYESLNLGLTRIDANFNHINLHTKQLIPHSNNINILTHKITDRCIKYF